MKSQKLVKSNRQQPDRVRELRIKVALFKKGITQRQVATELGIKPCTVSAYVTGFSYSAKFNEWVEKNLKIKV